MAGIKKYEEWYLQSDYDLEVAMDMLKSGRNVYAIFMCHLSLEKVLKGLFTKTTNRTPMKTHDLEYFVLQLNLKMNESDIEFVAFLNKLSIPTRYPENLKTLFTVYNHETTEDIMKQAKKVQSWIRQQ